MREVAALMGLEVVCQLISLSYLRPEYVLLLRLCIMKLGLLGSTLSRKGQNLQEIALMEHAHCDQLTAPFRPIKAAVSLLLAPYET